MQQAANSSSGELLPQAMTYSSPHFVSAQTSADVAVWRDLVAKLKGVYSVPHSEASSPRRTVARGDRVWLRALTATPPKARFMGAKVFGFGRQKQANYLIALFEQDTGLLTALVDGYVVTAMRTAATTALAVERMTANRPLAVGLLGSGHEAKAHLQAIAATRPIAEAKVFSPRPDRREAFAREFTAAGVRCTAVTQPQAAVEAVDVVVAAARAYGEQPILRGEWLRGDLMIASIGSTLPEQREIDEQTIGYADLIICDAPDEVLHETGDFLTARAAGVSFESKVISLNDLMCGLSDHRASASRRPLYKSVGAGIQDVVVAEFMFERALAAGLAVSLNAPFVIRQ